MDDFAKPVSKTYTNNDNEHDELSILDDSIVSLDEIEEKPELNYGDTYDEANIGFEDLEDEHDELDIDLEDDEDGVEDFVFEDDSL